MAFFILTRFVLVKYSRAFVERPSQGTSSLASRLTTVSLDLQVQVSIPIHRNTIECVVEINFVFVLLARQFNG